MTEYVEIRGEARWAKIFEENRDKKGPNDAWVDFGGKTTIQIHSKDRSVFEPLEDVGSQKRIKKDKEDGTYYAQFDRKWDAPYTYGGAPRVVHADGETDWDINQDGLVGNGSEVIVLLSVQDVKGMMATRLEGVQVIDHVEYESDFDPDAEYGPPGFKDQTKGKTTAKKATKAKAKKVAEDMPDDEIPF